MTVGTSITSVELAGNGTAREFSFSPIAIYDDTQLEVVVRDSAGTLTTISRGTGASAYSVHVTYTENQAATGYIRYPDSGGTLLPTGSFISIRRVVPLTQTEIDIENQGGYLPEVQEMGFDLMAMRIQQVQEEVDRSVKVPFGSDLDEADYLSEVEADRVAAAASAASASASAASAASILAAVTGGKVFVADSYGSGITYDSEAAATDNTTALQAAIDAAKAAGGGVVVFAGQGTVWVNQFVIKTKVVVDGGFAARIELKAAGGLDDNLCISENFATLTGTGAYYENNTAVPRWFGLKDIRINGNKANQTAGNGLSWYGNGQLLLGTVIVSNCYQDNIYTEASDQYPSFYSGGESLWETTEEGFFQNVISRHAGRHGWLHRGPHNYSLHEYLCILDNSGTGWGFRSEVASGYGGQSDLVGKIHVYSAGGNTTNRQGVYFGASTRVGLLMLDSVSAEFASRCLVSKLEATGAGKGTAFDAVTFSAGSNGTLIGSLYLSTTSDAESNFTCINVDVADVVIGALRAYNNTSGTDITCLDVAGGTLTANSINIENFNGTNHVGLKVSSGFNYISGSILSCKTGLNYTVSGGNNNTIDLNIFTASGQTALAGNKPGQSDRFDIRLSGATTGGTERGVVTSSGAGNRVDMTTTTAQTIAIAHGCPYTPETREVSSPLLYSNATGFSLDYIKLASIDATNLTFEVKLATAASSGTVGDIAARVKIGQ